MSFEIKKIYTDNPYVDELVYYTKQLGIGTVLKMQSVADNNETVESLKASGLYISCIERTAVFNLFEDVTTTALASAGITDPTLVAKCLANKSYVPQNKRDAVTEALMNEYIENYVELNPYYRSLNGLPPIDREDYVTDWLPPEGISIDLSKPVHMMNNAEASILDRYGVLEDMIEEDPINRQYMRHLGDKAIDIYFARRAQRFDPLYVPKIDSEAVTHMYKEFLNNNKFYTLRTVYSEAYNYGSDYYDNFIAVFIVLITVIDIISRVQEFIARKEIFDIRSVQYIFKSYGVPFFEDIPLKYQIAMVKNLHTLLKYKSTAKCMVSICSLFGFKNIKIFKYYLLRDRRVKLKTGEYVYAEDEEGNEDLDAEYELKFLKLPLDEDKDDYVRVGGNYVDYDEITYSDPKWDGGLDHDMVMKEILKQEFNFTRTKYISIDTIYEIAKMATQQSYFFNFLYDNVDLEGLLTVKIPYIDPGKEFKVGDVFTLLTALSYKYNTVDSSQFSDAKHHDKKDLIVYKDMISDTQSKVLYVNGFNFKADLATLAAEIGPKKLNDTVVDPGSTLHAQEQLEKFQIPTTSIPSFSEMMKIYVNNMEVRDELIKGMHEACNKKVYDVYKKLYDALMVVELTFDYYKNPETGEFYLDYEGDATYTEYLKHADPSLYYVLTVADSFEDVPSRNQYIANLIDSITYALEEYIDSEEYYGLFSNLPVVSTEAVKKYISSVINFYKSFKVDFLGMNTIYTFDDKGDGVIRLIDCMQLDRYFHKNDFLKLYERFAKNKTTMTFSERVDFIEKVYMDIKTWAYKNYEEHIWIRDEVYEIVTKLVVYTIVELSSKISGFDVSWSKNDFIDVFDFLNMHASISKYDAATLVERIWMIFTGDNYTPAKGTQLLMLNVVVPAETGTTTIEDIRITEGDKAVFIPDTSVASQVSSISCTCIDGSVTVTLESEFDIIGTIQIN